MMRNSGKFNNIPKRLLYMTMWRVNFLNVKSLSFLRLSQKFLQAGHSLYAGFDVNKRPYLK